MGTAIEKALIWVLAMVSVFSLVSLLAFTGELFLVVSNAKKSQELGEEIEARLSTLPSEPASEVMLFVGDIMLSRSVGIKIRNKGDYKYPFLEVADTLRGADMAFGNLESPISSRGYNQGSIYSFRAQPEVIEGLVYAGFDVLSLANNHIWDWGREALFDTVSTLENAGITPVGAGANEEAANKPAIFELKSTKVAILAYTNLLPTSMEATVDAPGLSHFDLEAIKGKVADLKLQKHLVVVSMHWGEEYELVSNVLQQEIARALIDAGADLVVGHHPHVVQELEKYGEGWIAYSLGNFVFDQNFSEETMKGVVLKAEVQKGKIISAVLLPVQLSADFQPSFVEVIAP